MSQSKDSASRLGGIVSGYSTDEGSDESTSTVRANPQPNPPYLYYRLFTSDIAVPSEHPAFPRNTYVGRVRADSVAPPQTVLLIKRRLCAAESMSECFANSTLFCSRESKSPMDDGERVSILTPGFLGSNPDKPVELVVNLPGYRRRDMIRRELSANSTHPEPQYIYYKLYAEHGEIPAKHPIYPNTDQFHSLARIDVKLIPPPHTLYTLIRCISFFEDFPYNGWHQLFGDIASESPLENENALVRRSGGPGSTPDRPLAFVRSAEMAQRIRSTARCSS